MRQFFKFMFASMLGFFLTFIIIFFFMIMMLASLATFSKKDDVVVRPQSVLKIKLDFEVPDRTSANPFENINFMSPGGSRALGLNEILRAIDKAKHDDRIEGIFLDLHPSSAGIATIEEIRDALIDFRESGKFIVSYGEIITQKDYYLASVSDAIYIMPEGIMLFQGLSAQLMFFKGTLDKLDIEPQVIRYGKFKSAVEPFTEEKMSQENKEQMLRYINSTWTQFTHGISQERGLSTDQLNLIADSLLIRSSIDALKHNMVDGVIFYDQFIDKLKERMDLAEKDNVSLISLQRYNNAADTRKSTRTRDRIAIVYASGEIYPGSGSERSIYSDNISKAIRTAREDTTVKAVVFRINSPGGSALASEAILREAYLTREEKPFIVSFGNLAASGGYYIACAADRIVSSPSTITGSIGVFGIIPNAQKFFENKLGITFDVVKTNAQSDFGNLARALTPQERAILQAQVEQVYKTFANHVAEARNMTFEEVDAIGQGRIWTGTDALEIGLVDELGGLNTAVKLAAELAEIEDYRILELPHRKDFFTQLIEDMSGGISQTFLRRNLGQNYAFFEFLNKMDGKDKVQARLPFDVIVE